MLLQRQDGEEELNRRIQKLMVEKQSLQEMIATLQRKLASLEAEKRNAEISAMQLEKDRNALKKNLNKVKFSGYESFYSANVCISTI